MPHSLSLQHLPISGVLLLVYCLPPGCRRQTTLGDLRAGLVILGCTPATAAVGDTHMGGAHVFMWEIQR